MNVRGIIDKYGIMQQIDEWLQSDEECSKSCEVCEYKEVCNRLHEKVGNRSTIDSLIKDFSYKK